MKKLVLRLSGPVRVLNPAGDMPDLYLDWNRISSINQGSEIEVGEPEMWSYHDAQRPALPIDKSGNRFVLFSELSDEDVRKVREAFPKNHLIAS